MKIHILINYKKFMIKPTAANLVSLSSEATRASIKRTLCDLMVLERSLTPLTPRGGAGGEGSVEHDFATLQLVDR
jgi:hypothetical protein